MPDTPTLQRLVLALAIPAVLAAVAVLAAPASAADGCAGAGATPTRETLAGAEAAVVCEINDVRRDRGLPRIDADPELERAAQRHASDMVRRRFFSHVTPGGRTMTERLRAAGYIDDASRWAAGEVLAWGTRERSSPAATVAAWMASPAHRQVLLSRRYRDVGIGIALGAPVGASSRPAATYSAELGFVAR